MKRLVGSTYSKMTAGKLDRAIDGRLREEGHGEKECLAAAELQELCLIGRGVMWRDEFARLQISEGVRSINKQNVQSIALLLVTRGFNKDFPLTVGVTPIAHSPEREFRATLIGGGHRLAAVLECEKDWRNFVRNKPHRFPWRSSTYSASNRPQWLDDLPVTVHYLGPEEKLLANGFRMGQAQNDLHDGVSKGSYYDKMHYIIAMRAAGETTGTITKGFPADVKENHYRKLMADATLLSSGRFPALEVLAYYYNEFYTPSTDELFTADRFATPPARDARKPFAQGRITSETGDKCFGAKVYATLVLRFQALSREGRPPSLRDGLATRVTLDSPLAKSCGPYSEFLEQILELVVNAVTNSIPFKELLKLETREQPGLSPGVLPTEETCAMDLGMAVVNKLLTDGAFLVEQDGKHPETFSIPEGDEWHNPVIFAICSVVDDDAIAQEIMQYLFPSLRQSFESDDDDSTNSDRSDSVGSIDRGPQDEGASDDSDMTCSEDEGDVVSEEVCSASLQEKAGEGTRRRTLCYTGLSRVLAEAVPVALQSGDSPSMKVHTIIVHEADPKLKKVYEEIKGLRATGCLYPTPVIIAVRREGSCAETSPPYHSDDDEDATPDFTARMKALAEILMMISPKDPSRPWTKENAGHLLVVHGSDITMLLDSDTWERDVPAACQKRVERFSKEVGRATPGSDVMGDTVSPDFYTSLLCRFHLEGTAVLSTWDPCGIEQAAACRLGRDSLSFLGLSTRRTVNSVDLDSLPLLGWSNDSPEVLLRVLADHAGSCKDSASLSDLSSGDVTPWGGLPGGFSALSYLPPPTSVALPLDGGTAVGKTSRAGVGTARAVNPERPTAPRKRQRIAGRK